MAKQRFSIFTKSPDAYFNLGESFGDKFLTEYGDFGYPGYSFKTKQHHFTDVGKNLVTQVGGDTKIQGKGEFRLYSSGDMIHSTKSWATLGAFSNVTLVTGCGQGSAPIPTFGAETEIERWNALKLWHQVFQHNLELQHFLGDGTDWVDVAKGEGEPVPEKKSADVELPAGVLAPPPPRPTQKCMGWFSKRAAWTGHQLGVSLRDNSQDLRGVNTKTFAFKLWPPKLLASNPWGIWKDSQNYPAITLFDPYEIYPPFIKQVNMLRDLASRAIGLVEKNAVTRAIKVVNAAQGVTKAWNQAYSVFAEYISIGTEGPKDQEIVKAWGAFQAHWNNKIVKTWNKEDFWDSTEAYGPGEKASILSKKAPFSLPPDWVISIKCEGNAKETTKPAGEGQQPARLPLSCDLVGRKGPEALHLTSNDGAAVLSVASQVMDYTANTVAAAFAAQTDITEIAGAGTSIIVTSSDVGDDQVLTVRPLTPDEWRALADVDDAMTDALAMAQAVLSFEKLTGSATPLTETGYDGPTDLDNLSVDDLISIINTCSCTYFTASKVQVPQLDDQGAPLLDDASQPIIFEYLKLESKHTAAVGAPSIIEIIEETPGTASAIGMSGAKDKKEKTENVSDVAGEIPGQFLTPLDAVKAFPGNLRQLYNILDRSLDDFYQIVEIFMEDVYKKTLQAVVPFTNKYTNIGLFGAGGITLASGDAVVGHARKGFCFVASATKKAEDDWPTGKYPFMAPFIFGYKVLRKVEKTINLDNWFGKLKAIEDFLGLEPKVYGTRDLGFRVRANNDVDLLSGRVATLAAIGRLGFTRVLGLNAVELTSMHNIAIAARDADSSVEVLGGNIFIGAANDKDFLTLDQLRFSKVEHVTDRERVAEDGKASARSDLTQDLSKSTKSDLAKDKEPVTVKAWANEKNIQRGKTDDIVQKPTQQVAMTAKNAISLTVGKYMVSINGDGVNVFCMEEEPKKTPSATGWALPQPGDHPAGPIISMDEKGIEIAIAKDKDAKRGRLLLSDTATVLEGAGGSLTLENNRITMQTKGKKGLIIDSGGLHYLDGSTQLKFFDGKKILESVEVTAVPTPAKDATQVSAKIAQAKQTLLDNVAKRLQELEDKAKKAHEERLEDVEKDCGQRVQELIKQFEDL